MKKLSVLIAMLLCVTIGGVYATWNYAKTEDITDGYYEIKATIADAKEEGANGVYTITSNAVITIDDTNNDKIAELTITSNNGDEVYLKITFEPAEHATPEIKANGVESELYYGTTIPMEVPVDANGNYVIGGVHGENGVTVKDIFTFSNVKNGIFEKNVSWTNVDGVFTYTLTGDDLADAIQLNGTFILDTKAEHDAFRTALAGNIMVYVTDGTVNN